MGKGKKGKYANAPKSAKSLRKLAKEGGDAAAAAAAAGEAGSMSGTTASTDAELAELAEKKFTLRPTPEMYPHIVCTYGTNENKVHPNAKDIRVENLSLIYHGREMLVDTELVLSYGQRYGILGPNGVGKTTLLRAIASRMMPIPKNIDIYLVESAISPSDKSAIESVLEVDEETKELHEEVDRLTDLLGENTGMDDSEQLEVTDRISEIYERLDELDADTARVRAAGILGGLGFTPAMQEQPTKDFSGGWRMRVSLARALFINPTFLILDEPTNHLDMEAVVWFEEYLKNFKKILLMVSHSQDFLNGVCTSMIHMNRQRLEVYGGNYDTYMKTRKEKETMQMKKYEWEQDQIAHMKEYIARFGHGSANLARQAQSKEKTLAKMERAGLTEKVMVDKTLSFRFHNCGKLPPPVLQFQEVSFAYPGRDEIYHKIDFGMDLDSRIALVGPNGAGKSTLLNLLMGKLSPTEGMVRRHHHLRIANYSQHFVDQLSMEDTPLSYMMKEFPKDMEGNILTIEKMRSIVGRFGITGATQTMPIMQLSDGQKARVVFAWISEKHPHLLCLDEPTNCLDIETIDSLAHAINNFDGGLILVSHDMRLISQVADEIWICDKGQITRFEGSIMDFKMDLRKQMNLEK